ncbi:MAG TPA: hypothetical protein VN493_07490 [Thermoanaerobaculia bacterium]|nr:hypothetical protein [Thermoanaerobaculia bacterium]
MLRTVENRKDPVLPMLFPQFLELVLLAEPVMPGLRILECLPRPSKESSEVGVVQPVPAADEEQGVESLDGSKNRLGVLIAADVLVGADAQDDRLRLLPIPVKMEDAGLLSPDDPGGLVAIPPGHGWAAGGILQQAVVVRGRDGQAEIADGLDDGPILRLQLPYRLMKPAAVLAACGEAELAGDFFGSDEEVV